MNDKSAKANGLFGQFGVHAVPFFVQEYKIQLAPKIIKK